MIDPTTDCPPCPECGLELGTPIKASEQDRWHGSRSATLYCPACGAGWVGSQVDFDRALKSWRAYEASMEKS